MSKYKHHSYFTRVNDRHQRRFPFVCLTCRKSFKYIETDIARSCAHCHGELIMLSRKFAAPKMDDIAQWEKVAFLIEHGFLFYSVYQPFGNGAYQRISYPKTLAEAKEFVQLYKP